MRLDDGQTEFTSERLLALASVAERLLAEYDDAICDVEQTKEHHIGKLELEARRAALESIETFALQLGRVAAERRAGATKNARAAHRIAALAIAEVISAPCRVLTTREGVWTVDAAFNKALQLLEPDGKDVARARMLQLILALQKLELTPQWRAHAVLSALERELPRRAFHDVTFEEALDAWGSRKNASAEHVAANLEWFERCATGELPRKNQRRRREFVTRAKSDFKNAGKASRDKLGLLTKDAIMAKSRRLRVRYVDFYGPVDPPRRPDPTQSWFHEFNGERTEVLPTRAP